MSFTTSTYIVSLISRCSEHREYVCIGHNRFVEKVLAVNEVDPIQTKYRSRHAGYTRLRANNSAAPFCSTWWTLAFCLPSVPPLRKETIHRLPPASLPLAGGPHLEPSWLSHLCASRMGGVAGSVPGAPHLASETWARAKPGKQQESLSSAPLPSYTHPMAITLDADLEQRIQRQIGRAHV